MEDRGSPRPKLVTGLLLCFPLYILYFCCSLSLTLSVLSSQSPSDPPLLSPSSSLIPAHFIATPYPVLIFVQNTHVLLFFFPSFLLSSTSFLVLFTDLSTSVMSDMKSDFSQSRLSCSSRLIPVTWRNLLLLNTNLHSGSSTAFPHHETEIIV